jgi:hypothetical protein
MYRVRRGAATGSRGQVGVIPRQAERVSSEQPAACTCSEAAHGRKEVEVGVAPHVDHVVPRVGAAGQQREASAGAQGTSQIRSDITKQQMWGTWRQYWI